MIVFIVKGLNAEAYVKAVMENLTEKHILE